MKYLVFVLVTLSQDFITVESRSIEDSEHGCAAPYTLPNLPYFVAWNIPSGGCERTGVDLNLTAYRIVSNKNDSFVGEQMTIFYGEGAFPFYRKGVAVNGGLPQLGNITYSLMLLRQMIEKSLPDPNFSGLAVFDWEGWRPHLGWNFERPTIYITESRKLVQKQYPTWTDKHLIAVEAERQFDSAARMFMQLTLEEARSLRPLGHWGYYGYPRCWGPTKSDVCGKGTTEANDLYTGWLYSSSTGLYPRIYTGRSSPLHQRYIYIRTTVNETLRIQAKWTGLHAPVMPYSLDQDNATDFFQKDDLEIAITEPSDMGASGVVIWGSSGFFHTKNECLKMRDNIRDNFGPFVKNITDFAEACAKDLCNFHGRCVRKDYEMHTQHHLRMYQKKRCLRSREEYENLESRRQYQFGYNMYSMVSRYDNYICRCIAGYHGEYCEKKGV